VPPGGAAPGPEEPAPGLGEQVGATREAGKRLVDAHLELARAEFADIADAAKRAAAFIGIAIGAGIFAALLVAVGLPLFLGEWLFGSIGWGILLGLLLMAAIAIASIGLALSPSVNARVGRSFIVAAIVGIIVGVVLGLDLTNRAWTAVGDAVAGNVDASYRPLLVGVVALAIVGAVIGLVGGFAAGGGGMAIGGLVIGLVGGALIGALTAIATGPRVGAAIGVAVGLVVWIALMGTAMAGGGFDTDKLKDRFWPSRTIEVTKETIEWARERMPLKRPS
jgi:MFS family permease